MMKDGFYGLAKITPSPNRGGPIAPRVIIVHDTAGALNAEGSVAWLCNPKAEASAHFVISREGKVHQLISTNLKAWHAGVSQLHGVHNVNGFSIGIELVNPGPLTASGAQGARAGFGATFDRKHYGIEEHATVRQDTALGMRETHKAGLWMPYPTAQLDALLALCLELKKAYGITEVRPHWYIAPGRKVDTSPLFPLRWLQAKMDGRKDSTAVDYNPNLPLEVNWDKLGEPKAGDIIQPVPGEFVLVPSQASFRPGTIAHAYPSLNMRGSTILNESYSYLLVEENGRPIAGEFPLTGEECPKELEGIMIPWVKIKLDAERQAWVPADRIATERTNDDIGPQPSRPDEVPGEDA